MALREGAESEGWRSGSLTTGAGEGGRVHKAVPQADSQRTFLTS